MEQNEAPAALNSRISKKSNKKQKKQPRARAELPKGFRDYFGSEVTDRLEMLEKISSVYKLYGFEALESPAIETVEALGKFLPDVDRPNEGIFAWQDEDESWMALRYDLTAPLARVYAAHRDRLPSPYRRYAFGPVWRNEKPGPGRFRQFYQCDADIVGSASMAADAEIALMLKEVLITLGIAEKDFRISLNNRKILNGVMEVAGLYARDEPEKYTSERGIVLRAIDKLDRLGVEGVAALLGEGRQDVSGDYTKGAGLTSEQTEIILGFISAKAENDEATLSRLSTLVQSSEEGASGVQELGEICEYIAAGQGAGSISVEPSVVRGLGYYTGPVMEAELTFEILDEHGNSKRFGSVAGGGRYDDLVKRFTGQAVPATGIALGVDRLLAALASKQYSSSHSGPIVITVMDRSAMPGYLEIARELRAAGIIAEVYLGNPKNFGNQLKYADRRRSPIAVIEGEEERARGVLQIKDLIQGAALAEDATLEEWKARPSQIEVPRSNLVAEIRSMLARQAKG